MASDVPFLDVGASFRELAGEITAEVNRVLGSGWYVLGETLAAFEQQFASYVDAAHCIGVANGLDALHLALLAAGVGPGDEVIVPAHTFIATWLAVSMTGATIVPVDVDPRTYNLRASAVRSALTPRTAAVVVVHLYGQPAQMQELRAVADSAGVLLVEDAAQAHGARSGGSRVGALGDLAAWSFYPAKNLGALGDAGAVTTDDPKFAERVRMLRNYGCRERYRHEMLGRNSRMDEVQAAVLSVKLAHLDDWNDRRSGIAAEYERELSSAHVSLPAVADDVEPVWHLYVVESPVRDALQRHLTDCGVASQVHYPAPPHLQPAYSELGWSSGAFPVAERVSAHVLSLPIGPQLSEEARSRVVDAVLSFAP